MGSGVEVVETEVLRDRWSAMWKQAADGRFIQVNWYGRVPTAMLISTGRWHEAQRANPELAVANSKVIERTSTDARIKIADILDDLNEGFHTLVMFHRAPRAVFTPFEWARTAFPDLALDPIPEIASATGGLTDQVLVVYRKARTDRRLIDEFAGTADPVWEADRRLTSLRGPIPLWRRPMLHAVVYVVDGRVARIRTVDPAGTWHELGGVVSLAPVSAVLSRNEIDEQLPSLGMYPGDERAASIGASREYTAL